MKRASYIFRPVQGIWRNVAGDGEILADILLRYAIVVDDRAQFCRLYDYQENMCFVYRHYNDARITLDIYTIES